MQPPSIEVISNIRRIIMTKKAILLVIALIMFATPAIAGPKVIVGTSADWPFFEWVDKKGNIVGFDMDVMRMIGLQNNWNLEIKDIPYDSLIPALKAGKIDIIAAQTNITPERAKQVDFSAPYWTADLAILVSKDAKANMANIFSNGHKIGAQTGTTQAGFLEEAIKGGAKFTFKPYETNDLILMDIKAGRIDAFIGDTPVARVFAESWPVKMIGILVPDNAECGFMVQKGDSKSLLAPINNGVKKLQSDGVWPLLTDAYAGGDLKKITECYAGARGLLEKGDAMGYAEKLKGCMMK
jgi:polar amino acid transport system substrate-binding protein